MVCTALWFTFVVLNVLYKLTLLDMTLYFIPYHCSLVLELGLKLKVRYMMYHVPKNFHHMMSGILVMWLLDPHWALLKLYGWASDPYRSFPRRSGTGILCFNGSPYEGTNTLYYSWSWRWQCFVSSMSLEAIDYRIIWCLRGRNESVRAGLDLGHDLWSCNFPKKTRLNIRLHDAVITFMSY